MDFSQFSSFQKLFTTIGQILPKKPIILYPT